MFRRVVSRLTMGALLVASVAALVGATAGSANVGFVTTTTYKSTDGTNACPGFGVNERHYCLVVTTFNNLERSGGLEVDLKLENWDQSALTNPSTDVTWTNTNVSFVSSNPSICSLTSTSRVTCNFPNLPGVGSTSGPNATPTTSSVKLFFGAAVAADVNSVNFKAVANAKESGNDNTGAANVESQTVDPAMVNFDTNANADATVVLPTTGFNKPHLHTTVGNAFLDFTSSSPAFIAQFAASSGVACVLNVSCTGLDLNTDLSGAANGTFSTTNPILWTADVTSTNTNIVAVHTYDPVPITPSPPNTLKTAGTGFAKCDGVVFDSFGTNPQSNLSLGQTYFVRNPTTDGTNTSLQVSATAKGSLINVTGTGSFSGSCVREIGDDSGEKTKQCTLDTPPSAPASLPVLCAVKKDNTTVRAYLLDAANGHVGY
jgi:hypothetical protein